MVFIIPLLPFTTRLVSKLAAKLLSKRDSSAKSGGEDGEAQNKPTPSAEDVRTLFIAMRNYAKSHRAFKLVEVSSEDGTSVLVSL